jgi:hypothetical protein
VAAEFNDSKEQIMSANSAVFTLVDSCGPVLEVEVRMALVGADAPVLAYSGALQGQSFDMHTEQLVLAALAQGTARLLIEIATRQGFTIDRVEIESLLSVQHEQLGPLWQECEGLTQHDKITIVGNVPTGQKLQALKDAFSQERIFQTRLIKTRYNFTLSLK